MAGETLAAANGGATRTPSSGSKTKGYSDLKSRLQKLQESPSFAVPAGTATPASARSTGEWAVHSARAPHSAAAAATPPSVSSARQHPAAEWTVLSAREAGSSGLRARLPAWRHVPCAAALTHAPRVCREAAAARYTLLRAGADFPHQSLPRSARAPRRRSPRPRRALVAARRDHPLF